MSHVTHMKESWHTCEWVMSHIWMSHVTPMNDSCRQAGRSLRCKPFKRVTVTHTNESWHTYEWVMSHPWTSHVKQADRSLRPIPYHCMNASWHTWMSHDTHITESQHARMSHEWATTHMNELWMSHDTPIKKVTSHIWMHRACQKCLLF